MKQHRNITGAVIFLCCCVRVFADIATDGTVGPAAQTLSGPHYAIGAELGQQAGNNLFHSFSEFSVDSSESATFSGPTNVENVISRVTGGSISTIDGILRSEISGADFYFVNPAGVLFGSDARLDVSGSFHVSTADYIKFGDDQRFYSEPLASEVLSVAAPAAFGFLDDTVGKIEVVGSELALNEGKVLSLVGGETTVNQGSIQVEAGQVNIVSVASAGEVRGLAVPENDLELTGFQGLGSIQVENAGKVDVNGAGGGRIFIRGGSLVMIGGASLSSETQGSEDGQGIDIAVEAHSEIGEKSVISTDTSGSGNGGTLEITAGSLNIDNSIFYSDVDRGATGDGGTIAINVSDQLNITNGTQMNVNTFGAGAGGTLEITTGSLNIDGFQGSLSSGLFADVIAGATGNGGNINITVSDQLSITNLGAIAARSFGSGDGGSIKVTAGSLIIDGSLGSLSSGLFATVREGSSGNGGSIDITVNDHLSLSNGGGINTSTYEEGSGGSIKVAAGSLSIDGFQGSLSSGLFADVIAGATGNGGNINITVSDQLSITNLGAIAARSFGSGDGGLIKVTAGSLIIDGSLGSLSSGLFAAVREGSSGNGGNIDITVNDHLSLSNGGGINTSTYEEGSGGSIKVTAGSLSIDGFQGSLSSGLFADVIAGATGNGGNINITVSDQLSITNLGAIAARSFGSGDGGSIKVTADSLSIDGSLGSLNSGLFTDVAEGATGNSGNINITVNNQLSLTNGGEIYAKTLGSGDAGYIAIAAKELILANGAVITTSTSSTGNAGDIIIGLAAQLSLDDNNQLILDPSLPDNSTGVVSRLLLNEGKIESSSKLDSLEAGKPGTIRIAVADAVRLENNAILNTSAVNSPDDPDQLNDQSGTILIQAPNLVYLFDSSITTNVQGGSSAGGNIAIDPKYVILNNSQITADAFGGSGGNIDIVAEHYFQSSDSLVSASSQQGIDGQINISSPVRNISGSLISLPESYLDADAWAVEKCSARLSGTGSSFVHKGRAGLPTGSNDLWAPEVAWALSGAEVLSSARAYFYRGHYGPAIVELKTGLAETSQSDPQRLAALLLLSQAYQRQGHYNLSETVLLEAQAAAQEQDNLAGQVGVKIALSDFYLAMQKRDKADSLGMEAIELAYGLEDLELAARALHNWGNLSLAYEDIEEAEFAYAESLSLYQEQANGEAALRVLSNSIEMDLLAGRFETALDK